MAAPEAAPGTRRVFLSHSTEATEAFGAALARAIEATPALRGSGVALALDGELGAGKTALARGVARGLGAADRVHSPSFTLMHTYAGRLPIYHFDAWMEGRERAFLEGGGAEWLDSGGVALIEWASRVAPWLPRPRLDLLLEHMGAHDPHTRRLSLSATLDPSASSADARSLALRTLVAEFEPAQVEAPPGQLEAL